MFPVGELNYRLSSYQLLGYSMVEECRTRAAGWVPADARFEGVSQSPAPTAPRLELPPGDRISSPTSWARAPGVDHNRRQLASSWGDGPSHTVPGAGDRGGPAPQIDGQQPSSTSGASLCWATLARQPSRADFVDLYSRHTKVIFPPQYQIEAAARVRALSGVNSPIDARGITAQNARNPSWQNGESCGINGQFGHCHWWRWRPG